MNHRRSRALRPHPGRRWVATCITLGALIAPGLVDTTPATAQTNPKPTSVVVVGPSTPVEEGRDAIFTITATPPPAGSTPVTLNFSTNEGFEEAAGATAGEDYTPVANRQITLTAPEYFVRTAVRTVDDSKLERPEAIVAQIEDVSANANRVMPVAIALINASDPPDASDIPNIPIPNLGPLVGLSRFSVTDVAQREGTGGSSFVEFTVTREGSTLLPAGVNYETADGTALAGSDYQTASGGLWFNIGVRERKVSVHLVTDSSAEDNETFKLLLRSPTGGTIADREGIATIVDDDAPSPPRASGSPRAHVTPDSGGYWVHDRTGMVFAYGNALRFAGVKDFLAPHLRSGVRVVAMAGNQTETGAWLADNRGGVYALGTATFHGSMPGLVNSGQVRTLPEIVDIAATPSGDGYTVLARDGGVFTFGKARFYGSLPGLVAEGKLQRLPEAVSMAYSPTGNGYWIVAADGGVFAFGDAGFFGSMPGLVAQGALAHLPRIVSVAGSPSGNGYILTDVQGGVFAFGDAGFFGSVPGLVAAKRIAHAVPVFDAEMTPSGNGYWVFGRTGGVYTFGGAPFHGATNFPDA